MNAEIIKQAAEKEIACHPDQKNIRFKIDDTIFWIKRKYSNKRNRLIKQPPETEFLFEVARIAIAAKACPELVPQIEVLTSEYMVTRDGGPTIEDWMEDPDLPFEEKKKLLYRIGASLAALHNAGVIHGRPAPRDILCSTGGKITFLDWESRHYCSRKETQKIQDFLLLLHGICRINYAEERDWLDAIEKGYTDTDKNGIKEKAVRFLRAHPFIGMLTKKLHRFHMTDVEAAEKLYHRFC